jgi:hypothetical protein
MESVETRWKCGALLACLVVACGATGATGAAASPLTAPLELSALTGPAGADLYITAPPGTTAFEQVHVQIRALAGSEESANRIINLSDVAAPGGLATIDLGEVGAGAGISVDAHVRAQNPPRTAIHHGETTVALRPDLAVTAVHAPPQTLSTRPIDLVADLSELNGETGVTATVRLMLGPTLLAEPKTVTITAGGIRSVSFAGVNLTTAMSAELTVVVGGAMPFETDVTNNTGRTKVEVTEHELVRSSVLVQSLGGYGGQFNQHVYAPVTNAPPESLPDMEAKAKALEPQLVRIFYNDNWEERLPTAPQNLASFIRTVQLAHESGATINITYQTAAVARLNPVPSMTRFAAVLEDLVETRGLTNVRWVTVQNEPNTPGALITLEQYNALYRALHAQLVERGLRDHLKLMGGDLIESSGARFHTIWWEYMEHNMSDVLDAYSVHIYWNYWDIPRMEFRLKDVHRIVTEEIAPAAQKPTYVMEFGVRGTNSFAGKQTVTGAYWEDGTELRKTNVAAFQQLWFNIASAQLGYTGASKWDAFWGVYDNTLNNQSFWMFGTAAEGWPIFPTYYALQLLLRSTERGWQVVRIAPWEDDDWQVARSDEAEKELVAYASADSQLTVMGLDTHARFLNTNSAEAPQYSIGGLPAHTTFNLALWNAAGNGESSLAGTVTTDAVGVARFEVPLHAAFSLTTVPGV